MISPFNALFRNEAYVLRNENLLPKTDFKDGPYAENYHKQEQAKLVKTEESLKGVF